MMPSRKQIEKWGINFGILTAVIAGIYGSLAFIDNRIDSRLSDPETLRELSSMVRPSCIFDQDGSILHDAGAMQIIESVELQAQEKPADRERSKLPGTIVVRPNRFLSQAPLLTVLDPYFISVEVKRGQKFDWVYTIRHTGAPDIDMTKCRYRIEVLP